MSKNDFFEGRRRIQKLFLDEDFLKPISQPDLPLKLMEKNNKQGSGKLRVFEIDDIPACHSNNAISYTLDLELANKIYSNPPGYKTCENAIILLAKETMFVVLIEMKSTLNVRVIDNVDAKIRDSIGRISLFLTCYNFDTDGRFKEYRLKYYALIVYNDNVVNKGLEDDKSLKQSDFVKILNGEGVKRHCNVVDSFGGNFRVGVIFKENPLKNEEYKVNFKEIFGENKNIIFDESSGNVLP